MQTVFIVHSTQCWHSLVVGRSKIGYFSSPVTLMESGCLGVPSYAFTWSISTARLVSHRFNSKTSDGTRAGIHKDS